MGKTTRFHPVSLHVIRGGAAYCGYKLGRIRQTELSEGRTRAKYVTTIEGYPLDLDNPSLLVHRHTLNECFVSDIQVLRVWQTYGNKIYVEIVVHLETPPGEDLARLVEQVEGEAEEVENG